VTAEDFDDGSGRLAVLRLADNVGPAAARNIALQQSATPFVCVLDADDFLLPGRIGKLVAEVREGVDFVADDLLLARPGSEGGPYKSLCGADLQPHFIDLEEFVNGNIEQPTRFRRELGFLKPLMRRSFLDAHGLKYNASLRLGEDYALYAAALARRARMKLVHACGYIAVVNPGSLSGNHQTEDLRALVAADDELALNTGLSSIEVAAIRAHQASVTRRVDYREFLEAKRKLQWYRAVAILLRTRRTARYITTQILRARLIRHIGFAKQLLERSDAASWDIYPSEPHRLFFEELFSAGERV
jgi:succinoglycan biosynthesis protein ExoU